MPFIQLKVQDLAHSRRMWWTCSYGFAIPHTAPPEGLKQRFGTAILVTLCTSEACAHRNIQNNNLNFRGLVFSVLLNSVNSYQCCCYQQPLDKEWQSCHQQPFDTLNPRAADTQVVGMRTGRGQQRAIIRNMLLAADLKADPGSLHISSWMKFFLKDL